MFVSAEEFLHACPESWIARHAPEFPVINVHTVEIPASRDRIFAALESPGLIMPRRRWKTLLGLRGMIGRLFGWDSGLQMHARQPLVPGNYWGFFRIEHVMPPQPGSNAACELGLSVENKLTRTLMSFVVISQQETGPSRVYCATCSVFFGRLGRAYWRLIRPFHDAIVEDMLQALRVRAERPEAA